MKIIVIVLALVVAMALFGLLYLRHRMVNTTDKKDLEADIDAEIGKFMKRVPGGLAPGLAVGIYKDGQSFVKGYGTTGKNGDSVPDAATIFQIGSISKLFTASLLQILCDEGVVRMDATLGELIGRAMPLSLAAQQVTLRQLVTHTSGFPRIPKPFEVKAAKMAGDDDPMLDPFSYLDPEFVFEYLATTEGKRRPGRFEYSNFSMGLLGHVLEVVTEKDFESLVAEKILAPLDMKATGITLTPELKEHLAQGHTPKGAPTRIWTFAALAGAGAFHSNAQDMLKFVRANVEECAPLSASFRKMHEPQFGGKTGIGWIQPTLLDKFVGNGNIVWHNGMVYGYASYLSIDAQTRTGVVILTNKAIGPDMLGLILTRLVRTQSWSLRTPSVAGTDPPMSA